MGQSVIEPTDSIHIVHICQELVHRVQPRSSIPAPLSESVHPSEVRAQSPARLPCFKMPAANSGVLRLPILFDQMAINSRVPMIPSGLKIF